MGIDMWFSATDKSMYLSLSVLGTWLTKKESFDINKKFSEKVSWRKLSDFVCFPFFVNQVLPRAWKVRKKNHAVQVFKFFKSYDKMGLRTKREVVMIYHDADNSILKEKMELRSDSHRKKKPSTGFFSIKLMIFFTLTMQSIIENIPEHF